MLLMLLMSLQVIAADNWFCTDDQAIKQGNTMMVCGIGNQIDEGSARQIALERAIKEFQILCEYSSDCKGHKVNIIPKRSNCVLDKHGIYKCHRLLAFTID